ncbi:MAG TPA: hypothetical protein VE956_02105 [Nodularia sp. (in: cyanobacteria)]|nr:hypothetical protein [Nodularia sp. (in: cyanobacteria)]
MKLSNIKITWYELFTFAITSHGFNHMIWSFTVAYPVFWIKQEYKPYPPDIDPDDIPF